MYFSLRDNMCSVSLSVMATVTKGGRVLQTVNSKSSKKNHKMVHVTHAPSLCKTYNGLENSVRKRVSSIWSKAEIAYVYIDLYISMVCAVH